VPLPIEHALSIPASNFRNNSQPSLGADEDFANLGSRAAQIAGGKSHYVLCFRDTRDAFSLIVSISVMAAEGFLALSTFRGL
jgi:hypothetical protein